MDRKQEGYNAIEKVSVTSEKYLHSVVSHFTPKSIGSKKILYEKKDKDETYQGDSLHLAYLLANVSCSRKLLQKNRKGDIWCTGFIGRGVSGPDLLSVNQDSFKLKLDAFLNENDGLFIVPSQNITPSIEDALKERDADLLNLEQVEKLSDSFAFEKKTILRVRPTELPQLINILFEASLQEDKVPQTVSAPTHSHRSFFISIIAVIVVVVLFALTAWHQDQDIIACLENGDFFKAEKLLQKGAGEDGDEFAQLQKKLNTPIQFTVNFEFMRQGEAVTLPSDSPQLAETVLDHNDNYKLIISCNSPQYPLYLYAYQEDYQGNLDAMFPNPQWNPGYNNPLRPDEFPYHIPPGDDGFYLDEFSLSETMNMPKEIVYVIASPWRARDIENLFGEVAKAVDPAIRKAKLTEIVERLKLRDKTALKSVCYKMFHFRHGGEE
ncbi:hypothetical protein [Desulfonema magnum]|nr:hypothetical protein [Desulfonema magnum]